MNASKPAGEWQTYDIRLVGRDVTVVHNGKKVLDKVHVDGLTAIANNADEGEAGAVHRAGRPQQHRDKGVCGQTVR